MTVNKFMDFILPMRNWNSIGSNLYPFLRSDFILPMRNWNNIKILIHKLHLVKDFILPMRNWNMYTLMFSISLSRILSYLWGIETYHSLINSLPISWDFILPMRNWNFPIIAANILCIKGFYLTYEELKQSKILKNHLTLYRILSYLWGIETSKGNIKVGVFEGILSYLWGIETWKCFAVWHGPFRILSYLWGIETQM